jgi:hypothetical protein
VFPIGFSRNCPVQMEKRDSYGRLFDLLLAVEAVGTA